MKDRHLSSPRDRALLQHLHRTVATELPRRRNRTVAILCAKLILYGTMLGGAYAGMIYAENPALLTISYICFGLAAVLLGFNFAHDFSHNTVFRSRTANSAGFILLYTVLGAHAEAWRHRHVHSHHYAPNVHGHDSDLAITNLIRVEPESPLLGFHRFQHWYAPLAYTSYSLYWVFIKDFVIYFSEIAPQCRSARYHLSFWLQKCSYLGIVLITPLICARVHPMVVVAGFLAMHLLQSLFLLFTFFITHHVEETAYFQPDAAGKIPSSWLENQVRSSNDFYPFSTAANFLFGGFNNHIAHHLFPHVHHVHYPELSRILYRELLEAGITPNATGYFSGIRSHLRHLRTCGRRSVKEQIVKA